MAPPGLAWEGMPTLAPMIAEAAQAEHVDLFQVRFPRLTQAQAADYLLGRLGAAPSTGVCFPDMSTLNAARSAPAFRRLLQHRVITFNDGAGLAFGARLRHRPFPANLNGTELTPMLLERAPVGTTVYLLGARPDVVTRAHEVLAKEFGHVEFIGAHHGYLNPDLEAHVMAELRRLRPDLVLVAMGNPLQVELVDRHLDDPELPATLWLGVGGLLDYYGGTLVRAPRWMVRAKLEWLNIVVRQPHKARRYLLGIPLFLGRCIVMELRGQHDAPAAA